MLYVVGTPIGNLGDISPRALEILGAVDFIAAEDTRVTAKLLNHFHISKPLISCREQNERARAEQIADRIAAGESCAVVTDAGMPCVSDPGETVVRVCAERGLEIAVVPGPSAAISALAVSGLPTSRFLFEGFLTTVRGKRRERLNELRPQRETLIFYEAPHKLRDTLDDLLEALGPRRISLCRELTKLHEEVIRTTLPEAVEFYKQTDPRGEYVLIVEGCTERAPQVGFEDAVAQVCALAEEQGVSAAAKAVAAETGYPKGKLYKAALDRRGADESEPD